MKVRTISSVVLMGILIGAACLGGKCLSIVLLLFAILAYRELFNIKYQDQSHNISIMSLLGYFCLCLFCLNGVFFEIDGNFVSLLPILLFTIPVVFYNDSKKYSIIDLTQESIYDLFTDFNTFYNKETINNINGYSLNDNTCDNNKY